MCNAVYYNRDFRFCLGLLDLVNCTGEGECEVAVFSAKCWDRRNREDLIESATPLS